MPSLTNSQIAYKCYAIYEKKGQSGVYDYINENYPGMKWEHCNPCECYNPMTTINRVKFCLVCGTCKEMV